MEKDLRDAYKALKLMRADLTRTRKEKLALEEQLARHCAQDDSDNNNNNNNSSNDNNNSNNNERVDNHTVQLQQLQTANTALQHENAELRLQNAALQQQLAQHLDDREQAPKRERAASASSEQAAVTTAVKASDAVDVNNQDHASSVRTTEPTESHTSDDDDASSTSPDATLPLKTQQQQPEEELEDAGSASSVDVEAMVREKLGLLASLFALRAKLEEQANELLAQQAAFARERDELCMQLEELSDQIVALQDHVLDVEHEKQFVAEKYAFLATQLDLVQQQQQQPVEVATDSDPISSTSREGLEVKLRELESIREQLETERRLLHQHQHQNQHQNQIQSPAASSSSAMTAESETARRLATLLHTNAALQQQVVDKDAQLVALQQQQQQQTAVADAAQTQQQLEADVRTLTAQICELTQSNELLTQALATAERERDAATTQLHEMQQQQQLELESLRSRVTASTDREQTLLTRLDAADTAMQSAVEQHQAACRILHDETAALHVTERELRDRIAALDAELAAAVSSSNQREQALETQYTATLAAQHETLVKRAAMEAKALQHETRQLTQALEVKHNALATALAATRDAVAVHVVLETRLQAVETQCMALEDVHCSAVDDSMFDDVAAGNADPAATWSFIASRVRALDTFLPQLQHFAGVVDTALCLCESNAAALAVLSAQHSGSNGSSLAIDVVSFLRFVTHMQRVVASTTHVKQARRLHRRVCDTLTHWCECVESDDDVPAPPFGIASREAALVLLNWTSNRSQRAHAKRWLEHMESVAATASSLDVADSSRNGDDCFLQAAEGSTLELQSMTLEVKHAFLMLIVPILRRNDALFVRVFTRLAPLETRHAAALSSSNAMADAMWEMKIHVQLRRPQHTRSASALTALRPTPLDLSAAERPLRASSARQLTDIPLASPPLSNSSNSSSSSNAQQHKLQIIQQRLQRMQSHGV